MVPGTGTMYLIKLPKEKYFGTLYSLRKYVRKEENTAKLSKSEFLSKIFYQKEMFYISQIITIHIQFLCIYNEIFLFSQIL